MIMLFYLAAAIAVIATVAVVLQTNIVHGLLYLILSLLAVAVIFYVLGAPFAAVLEAIVYAGAIMVLFLFVIMMLNLGQHTQNQERAWLTPRGWIVPSILAAALLGQLLNVKSCPLKLVSWKLVRFYLGHMCWQLSLHQYCSWQDW